MSTRGGPRVFLRKNPIIPICVQYDLYMSRKRQINIDKGQAQIASDRTKKAFDFFFFFLSVVDHQTNRNRSRFSV